MIPNLLFPLPPRVLSPNHVTHWGNKYKSRMQYKDECHQIIIAKQMKYEYPKEISSFPVKLHFDFYLWRNPLLKSSKLYYVRDEDNALASIKYLIDAFKQSGLVPDDGSKYISIGSINLYSKKKEHKNLTGIDVRIEINE